MSRETARGQGLGERMIVDLAQIAVREGLARLDLSVLDWNPAREFYHRLGFCNSAASGCPTASRGAALLALAGAKAAPAG